MKKINKSTRIKFLKSAKEKLISGERSFICTAIRKSMIDAGIDPGFNSLSTQKEFKMDRDIVIDKFNGSSDLNSNSWWLLTDGMTEEDCINSRLSYIDYLITIQ